MVRIHEGPDDTWPVADRYAELYSLSVTPDERGRGIGGARLDAVEGELARRGVADIAVAVMTGNTAAMALLRAPGGSCPVGFCCTDSDFMAGPQRTSRIAAWEDLNEGAEGILRSGPAPSSTRASAVQRRAGVERVAAQAARNVLPYVPVEFGEFLSRQPFVVVASQDEARRVWASLIVGGVGFARALDDRQILLASAPAPGDPLQVALEQPTARIGVLAIEFATRLRIRLNGMAQRTAEGIVLTVEEAFGNCPKFIQRRLPTTPIPALVASAQHESPALDARQSALVGRVDTFFIASAHPERGADASHRGGRPGFVEVSGGGRRVSFPDDSVRSSRSDDAPR